MLVALYIINSACWWHWHRRNVKRWRHIDDINDIIATAWHWLFHFLGGQANNYFHTKKTKCFGIKKLYPRFFSMFLPSKTLFFLNLHQNIFWTGFIIIRSQLVYNLNFNSAEDFVTGKMKWQDDYLWRISKRIALEYRYTPKCVHMWTIWHIVCVPKATFWCVRTLSSQLKMRSYTYWNWF